MEDKKAHVVCVHCGGLGVIRDAEGALRPCDCGLRRRLRGYLERLIPFTVSDAVRRVIDALPVDRLGGDVVVVADGSNLKYVRGVLAYMLARRMPWASYYISTGREIIDLYYTTVRKEVGVQSIYEIYDDILIVLCLSGEYHNDRAPGMVLDTFVQRTLAKKNTWVYVDKFEVGRYAEKVIPYIENSGALKIDLSGVLPGDRSARDFGRSGGFSVDVRI